MKERQGMGLKYAGVDIGGTTVKLGIFDEDGALLDKWEIKTRREDHGNFILPDIADSLKKKASEMGLELGKNLVAAGMGIPGPVQPDGHVAVCVNLGWSDLNPQEILSGYLGIPVKGGNDVNVASLGEMWAGGGKGYDSIVMIAIGTGVGAGVILNGEIYTGFMGAAGEIGHMHVNDEETEVCGCGGKGCLEQYASTTGIGRLARMALSSTDAPSSLRDYEEIAAKEVFDEAKKGDAIAVKVADKACRYLATAMQCVAMTIDPEAFIIGGGVSKAGQYLIDLVRGYYDELTPICPKKAEIVLAELGNDAGIYGAARLAMQI